MTVPAHFDGIHIQLDAEVALKPNTPLLITVLRENELLRDDAADAAHTTVEVQRRCTVG